MSKLRRFRVDSLEAAAVGAVITLPETEAKHARVLRLQPGEAVELFDAQGRCAEGSIEPGEPLVVRIRTVRAPREEGRGTVTVAVAWPKGKRAGVLVEKCSELGVNCILPTRFARSIVSKDEESEGISRLRRIAAEAAKQCGRGDVPEIGSEKAFEQVLSSAAKNTLCVLLDPRAGESLATVLERDWHAGMSLLLIVGPEGGFTAEEMHAADRAGVVRARMAETVLRVETAALAACAIAACAKL
ncbi:MAG TPA: RsmE family RNA methyltransferase [Planctomycetota bacterium]|nr:RsmE family RNA methyltransferase [Planctomycetota bacterium]